MDRLAAMETFVRIVDGGSLTAAADALRTSLPSVVRRLAALEAQLDVRLLNRTTRRLSLTDEGREYYERCKRVLADVEEAESSLGARRRIPKGQLRITSPVMFGRLHVAPVVTEFLLKHPAVRVELILLDRVVDLVEEGIDAAVRIGHLRDSSMIALPVGETGRVVCASPAWLKREGTPRVPAELAGRRCVNFVGLSPGNEWRFGSGPTAARVAIEAAFTSNQIDAALDACVAGVGPGQFLCYQVRRLLEEGKLKRLLREFEAAPLPVHVIYPHARFLSANVRAFVDWAVPRLKARLPPLGTDRSAARRRE
jgi:DNA-binding transcriptional LysR family regulator